MKANKIKVAFCVAYDWDLLIHALPIVYPYSDIICLAIDKERISWAGNAFDFDEVGFKKMVAEIDVQNKIKIYEDDFHKAELSPMQNEVRQRNLMANFLASDKGWTIQLDADEYFIDFAGFTQYLKKLKSNKPINICCPFMTLFKQVPDGYLWIKNKQLSHQDIFPVATNAPHYEVGRRNGYFNHITNFTIVHQSWARTEQEIKQKINNWGHKTDFDVAKYFTFWQKIDSESYQSIKNFHPINAAEWESLTFQEAENIESLLNKLRSQELMSFSKKELKNKNSIWRSRFRKLNQIIGNKFK